MGTDTPAGGGEIKPDIKVEDKNNNSSGRSNFRRSNNNTTVKKERFLGANPSLQGYVFESKPTRSQQVENFRVVDETIKAKIGADFDSFVLESLEKDAKTLPTKPTAPTADPTTNKIGEIEMLEYKMLYSKYITRVETIENQMKQTFSIYHGQISEDMKNSLLEFDGYKKAYQEKNVLELRRMLKAINFNYKKTEHPIKMLVTAKRDLMSFKQFDSPLEDYYLKYDALVKVVDELNHSDHGSVFIEIISREKGVDPTTLTSDQQVEMMVEGEERMKAMQLILNADKKRYGHLIEEFDRAYLGSIDRYPKTVTEAYQLLKNWNKSSSQGKNNSSIGVAFNTVGEETSEGAKKKCGRCGRGNHKDDECHARTHVNGTVLHTMGGLDGEVDPEVSIKFGCEPDNFIDFYCGNELEELMFLVNSNSPTEKSDMSSNAGNICESWLLLDSQSTIDVFSNAKLLSNIHRISTTLRIRCNAGMKTTNYRGYLSGYGWVWYYPDGIANILSLSRVKEKYRVTFDSALDNCFHVHKADGKILKFNEATRRLYYFDTADRDETGTMLITTVEGNKNKLSARDVIQAERARTLQRTIGRPNTSQFIKIVSSNQIPNCPITVQDIKNAEFIWGPELGCLKGKTVRNVSPQVKVENISIPATIMQQYREIILSVDIMKVNNIPFLMTISRHIKFGSAGRLDNMKNTHIIRHFRHIIGTYVARGFRVTIILADNQFESMRGDIANLGATLNVTARDEHVPEIERFNRTIKERVRANYNMLPFKYLPPIFIVEMIYNAVFWRNMFTIKGGISDTQSPSEIVLGRKLNFNNHCKIEHGQYVQTHEEHSNDMQSRTLGAIATRPSNDAGGYYFISLQTGRVINRRSWTPLPMPSAVVEQVHRLARRAKANKKLTSSCFSNIE